MTEEKDQTYNEDDPVQVRMNKRAALIESGDEAYARSWHVSTHAEELERRYEELEDGASTEDVVSIAGRVMAIRDQGKVCFIVLRDSTGDIQLFCRINVLGEEAYARMKDLDVGDWIGAEGDVMRTRRGQLSIAPHEVKLLSKSLRPLPEKFHGLKDKELRYRQRYVDLAVNPEVKDVFMKRFSIVAAVRHHMEEHGFIEVETPMLHPIPGGAAARPFVTHHNALDRDFYLRIAPELNLKRLLVGGFERVFELNRSFRNEGMDLYHNPEFTTMEAYQAYTDITGMMDLTEGVFKAACEAANGTLAIEYQGRDIDLDGIWPRRELIDLTSEKAGEAIDFSRSVEELRAICDANHVAYEDVWGQGKLICELFEALVADDLVQPVFVTGYPYEVSPLAKRRAGHPELTDRFELYICGKEYANAFSELNDPVDQKERFEAQVAAKEAGDDEAMGYDEDYIRALEYGMPPAGGVGIGIDRMVMLLTDSPSIRDVLLFPHMREEA